MKKTLYVDMDGVLVDFQSGIDRLTDEEKAEYAGREDDCPRIFELMDPVEGAIEGFTELAKHFDIYILSTSPCTSFRPHLGKTRTHQPTNWRG